MTLKKKKSKLMKKIKHVRFLFYI